MAEQLADDVRVLREALQAGPSPGEWTLGETYQDEGDLPETVIRGMNGRAAVAVTLDFGSNNPLMREANALHIIAAQPARIARVLSALEQAQRERDDAREQVSTLKRTYNQLFEAAAGLSEQIEQLARERDEARAAVLAEREACAQVCEAQMDQAEQDKADRRAREAQGRGDEKDQLARLRHWSVVSTFNAGLRNAAAAIRARGAAAQEVSHG